MLVRGSSKSSEAGRGARQLRRPIAVFAALAAVALVASPAYAAPVFTGVPSGTGQVLNYAWENGDPQIGGGSNGNISVIMTSDSWGTTCFSGSYPGSGPQLAVFYSKLASGGSAWSAPKRISGNYSADRGTLVTNGSNVYAAWASQKKYYSLTSVGHCSAYNFDTGDPRLVYFRRSTDDGKTWGAPFKLPGQGKTFRDDYNYMASNGSNVYIATTNVSNGNILLWVSSDSGVSFANPITIGTTTNADNVPGQTGGACPCGYTGGFTGLPAVATNGNKIGIAYTGNGGSEKIAICATDGTSCSTTQVAASGTADNYGYSQAAGDAGSGRMVFTWTTAAGAFSDVYSSGSLQGVKTITTFPDANFSGTACGSQTTACNQAGNGAIPVLLGSTGIGIALSECNTVNSVNCDESQTLEKSREILVWYESSNNGTSYGTNALIKAPGSAKNSYQNEFGSIANIGGVPYVNYAGHDAVYGAYQVVVQKCTGC